MSVEVRLRLIDFIEDDSGTLLEGRHAEQNHCFIWWLVHTGVNWQLCGVAEGSAGYSLVRENNQTSTVHLERRTESHRRHAQSGSGSEESAKELRGRSEAERGSQAGDQADHKPSV